MPDSGAKCAFTYHEATKHTVEKLQSSPHVLDWANMPEAFRHYEGIPLVDLPAEPPSPEIPALDVLRGIRGSTGVSGGVHFLSQLLYYSIAISAAKREPFTGDSYALRVNPSSGNLHPTEFHFATRELEGFGDGLYHYRVSSHMAEQRGQGDYLAKLAERACPLPFRSSPLVFVLGSIAWREAWKYRSRAYRYCLLDMGHAWQALLLAARALGCDAFAFGHFADDIVQEICCLTGEWPMLVVTIQGSAIPIKQRPASGTEALGGAPNTLSPGVVQYPLIDEVHLASKLEADCSPIAEKTDVAASGSGGITLPVAASSGAPFGHVARKRRSALNFRGGRAMIGLEQLSALLDIAMQPFVADFEGDLDGESSARYVQLYVYVHRVRDLAPGVYRYWPEPAQLELVRPGDQRAVAAGLSLGQELAGNACVAFSMVADLSRAARLHGNRGYRYIHMEAGAIGQRLYLASEAMGFRSTGIGAFFDDEVHRYLGINPEQGQVVYHFSCGYPIPDNRLEA